LKKNKEKWSFWKKGLRIYEKKEGSICDIYEKGRKEGRIATFMKKRK